MADRITEIVHLVRNVCEEENLRVTLKNSLKNGLAAGIGGTIGCILGGPWGGVPDRITEIVHLVRNVCDEEENLRFDPQKFLEKWPCGWYLVELSGCILGGPWGGVPGAAIGAAVAATIGEEFKPLAQVIAEWPDEAKQHLADNIESIMRRVDARDVATLAAMIAGATPALRAEIIAAVVDFCQNEMSLQITGR
ncbi:Protein C19orf12 like protein [Argiope bruennichi]|uniref:Protein C19orf12 like protein n=1 Tax=Argiope bruennichi TaxID=94029 RepID=A0A8T0EPH3_ARGBR|nr:Protein C19orf12 like protein [Argiope bruennichi]